MQVIGKAALGALVLGGLHGPARAGVESYDCAMTRGDASLTLRFDIDPASFAPALDAGDPPRRQVSRVTVGDSGFMAEAILSETGQRGFWAPARNWLLTMERDGKARLSAAQGSAWNGYCKETG